MENGSASRESSAFAGPYMVSRSSKLSVVITIIGILIAHLVAGGAGGAGGGAEECSAPNNLKQLTLAWHSYSDSCGTFPLNYQPAGQVLTATYSTYSWMQAILPQIDMAGLYRHVASGPTAGLCDRSAFFGDLSELSGGSNACSRVSLSVRRHFRQRPARCTCRWFGPETRFDPNVLRAVNNYKACSRANWSTSTNWANTCPTGRWANYDNALLYCNGVMCSNSTYTVCRPIRRLSRRNTTKIADVKDGLSNTFAIGEAVPAYNAWSWWFCNNTTVATRAIPLNNLYATSDTQESIFNWPENWCFCSFHPGAGFSMCDGSVAFISDNIDFGIYHALATIDVGEIAQVP